MSTEVHPVWVPMTDFSNKLTALERAAPEFEDGFVFIFFSRPVDPITTMHKATVTCFASVLTCSIDVPE